MPADSNVVINIVGESVIKKTDKQHLTTTKLTKEQKNASGTKCAITTTTSTTTNSSKAAMDHPNSVSKKQSQQLTTVVKTEQADCSDGSKKCDISSNSDEKNSR